MYSGFGSAGHYFVADAKVAEYKGKPLMTFFSGNDEATGTRGNGVILNERYRTVGMVSPGNGRAASDMHEFTVLPNGHALVLIYQPSPCDLTSYGVDQPVGWVVEAIFQEIVVATGEVVFEWKSLDHTAPSDSYHTLEDDYGDGLTKGTPWDYM